MNYIFKNRFDAATKLADKLDSYKNTNSIVLAIPRGGAPIGYYIANKLNIPLEIVLSKKIGHPNNPEFAIGSVSIQGVIIDEKVSDVSQEYILSESNRLLKDLKNKFKLFMDNRPITDLKNKIVILVDDGIATGNTMMATIETVKKSSPFKIVVAVPVAPIETAKKLTALVDEFVCLQIPAQFFGVGQFYADFTQVTDEDVISYLNKKTTK